MFLSKAMQIFWNNHKKSNNNLQIKHTCFFNLAKDNYKLDICFLCYGLYYLNFYKMTEKNEIHNTRHTLLRLRPWSSIILIIIRRIWSCFPWSYKWSIPHILHRYIFHINIDIKIIVVVISTVSFRLITMTFSILVSVCPFIGNWKFLTVVTLWFTRLWCSFIGSCCL